MNEQRAVRIAEIMSDFRNLHYFILQFTASPSHGDEYYLLGFATIRACFESAQVIISAEYDSSLLQTQGQDAEREKAQLQQYVRRHRIHVAGPFLSKTIRT